MVEGLTTEVTFNVHADDVDTMLRAVNERVFYVTDARTGKLRPPFQPRPYHFERELNKFRLKLLRSVQPSPKWNHETFLSKYTGRRLTIYSNASELLKSRGITHADAKIKGFGKPEKTNVSAKPNAVQRVISPRSPQYNLAVGLYLKSFEHNIYIGIKRLWGEQTIAKGLNAVKTATLIKHKFESFVDPVAIGFDAKRFDQHVSLDALKFEHSIYNAHFKDAELARLLKMQLINRVRIRCSNGSVKYEVVGGRMSGDMNTALGNCLLMCLMMLGFKESLQIEFKLINNGDDCVVFCERKHGPTILSKAHTYFKNFGFDMVAESPVYKLEQIVFCQTQPVWNGERYVMCRDPRITQSKDAISIRPFMSEEHYRSWLYTCGNGGISLTAGIPIMQSYYNAMIRNGNGKFIRDVQVYDNGLFKFGDGMTQESRQITSEARYSFYLAFGILPDSQRAREAVLEKLPLPYVSALDTEGIVQYKQHPKWFGGITQ